MVIIFNSRLDFGTIRFLSNFDLNASNISEAILFEIFFATGVFLILIPSDTLDLSDSSSCLTWMREILWELSCWQYLAIFGATGSSARYWLVCLLFKSLWDLAATVTRPILMSMWVIFWKLACSQKICRRYQTRHHYLPQTILQKLVTPFIKCVCEGVRDIHNFHWRSLVCQRQHHQTYCW